MPSLLLILLLATPASADEFAPDGVVFVYSEAGDEVTIRWDPAENAAYYRITVDAYNNEGYVARSRASKKIILVPEPGGKYLITAGIVVLALLAKNKESR